MYICCGNQLESIWISLLYINQNCKTLSVNVDNHFREVTKMIVVRIEETLGKEVIKVGDVTQNPSVIQKNFIILHIRLLADQHNGKEKSVK
jgi:hypothetical protein